MKLDTIFENEFNKVKLKRVRLNSDPANTNISYEGYVLYENSKFAKIINKTVQFLGLQK